MITCKSCKQQYVGKSKRPFKARLGEHLRYVKNKSSEPTGKHFNQTGHNIHHMSFEIIEVLWNDPNDHTSDVLRSKREDYWILQLRALKPIGINSLETSKFHTVKIADPDDINFIDKFLENIETNLNNCAGKSEFVINYGDVGMPNLPKEVSWKHRTCGTCKWWKRNRPGRKPRPHRCVWNHRGSARLMESQAGMQAVKELLEQGTPVKTIEGDGDNTLIARLKSELNLTVKKRFDKNHTIKDIVSKLYDLQKEDMKNNLVALIPHQFGDHSLCQPRFCGYKRQPGLKYLHRSLPYKAPKIT
ncbi:unnamed protein product [Mytilus edulis]|uniref:GIY-YIG domain-containing protein n=1 Tax=Mytilus edulis TaxID=6550 RepID=A0A8S3Q9T0_MYTED|nr:unnamed protein product [Mytilus edulis]